MKYFAAILLSLFLLLPAGQAGLTTDTSTLKYEIDGVEYESTSWTRHNWYFHPSRGSHFWEYHLEVFDHVIDNLDRRIDHLNATLKSLYLITCGSALARPDECTRLAAIMSELLAYNKSHVAYTCPFNMAEDIKHLIHENIVLVGTHEIGYIALNICRFFKIQTQDDYDDVARDMRVWLTGKGKMYINQIHRDRRSFDAIDVARVLFQSRQPEPTPPTQ